VHINAVKSGCKQLLAALDTDSSPPWTDFSISEDNQLNIYPASYLYQTALLPEKKQLPVISCMSNRWAVEWVW